MEFAVTMQLAALAIDALSPHRLAQFWAHALRWEVRETHGVGVELVPTDATTFHLLFRPEEESKARRNPIHFDLTSTSAEDQRDTVSELLAIGARHIDVGQAADDTHVVLADPEGNEFCIIEPDNRFLASCPRLGAVNGDGTRALGCFYSEVLEWPLVWDQDEETAIQAPSGTGPKLSWSGPPLLPKAPKERIHVHVAPTSDASAEAALDRLLGLGAAYRDVGHACPGAIGLSDPDGNELCLVEPQR